MVHDSYNLDTKLPSRSRFKQQRLVAWEPLLTARFVIPTFFAIGLLFIPIGIALYDASNSVIEYVYDYTLCKSDTLNVPCKDIVTTTRAPNSTCTCKINIEIKETITKDEIYVYYGLSNFYQNHRRYVKSRDNWQLIGVNMDNPDPDCWPNRFVNTLNGTVPIAPCGAIANSLFNDSFVLTKQDSLHQIIVPLDQSNVAWPSDRKARFINPTEAEWNKTIKPPNWSLKPMEFSTDVNETGFQNESLIVWMRVSALPNFRKLHSRIRNGLHKGNYTLHIDYNYPIHEFYGKKKFIISTTSWAGGKNPFLGIMYMLVGSVSVIAGITFSVIHTKYGKS